MIKYYIISLWSLMLLSSYNSQLSAQTPTVWLRANSGTLKAGNVPAGNGDVLTVWQDQGGSANHYTATASPTLVNNALNFNPAVQFITNGGFDAPSGAALGSDWTTFFISKKLPSDNDGRIFDGHTADYIWAHWGQYTNSIYLNGIPGNINTGIATSANITNLHLHTYKRESTGGTLEARADGTSLNIFGTSNSAAGIQIDIEAGAAAAVEHSDAQVGEMIIYNSALPATQIQKIESYLGVKYGITLAQDYVASDGTKIWDYAANTGYNSNITGIGRDDAYALSQPKSFNSSGTGSVTIDNGGVFAADKTFLLWGDDGTSGVSNNVSIGYSLRSKRVWKVIATGTPGAVSISVDLSVIGMPNTGVASNFTLLKDTDTDFSTGATTHTTGVSLTGNILSFTGVSLSGVNYFTLAESNVALPGGVVGAALWVRADAGVTGTTNVNPWADQSGLANDLTQSVATKQPSLVASDINFNPDVFFSGATTIMAPAKSISSSNTTIFAVARPNVNSDWRTMFRGIDFPLMVEIGSDRLGYYDTDDVGFKNSGFTWAQNEIALASVEIRSGNVNFRKNGTQGTSINTINLSGQSIDFFGNNQLGNQPFGKIAEAVLFNTTTALTTTEKNKVESYLAIKYGIMLSHDYIAADGTTIWSLTTNAGYSNLAGIGRDDVTTLSQQKSSSATGLSGITIDKGGPFGNDKSYLMWGDDGGTGASNNAPSGYTYRSKRIWKAAVVGTPGSVSVSIDLSAISMPNTGVASNFALLKDTDTDFSVGAISHSTGASLSGNILTFTGVNISDGNYLTVAVANGVLPGGIAGATLWVKADVGVTGTTSVNPWADQSGYGSDLTQGTVANQPSLSTNEINFNPAVYFSGFSTIMSPAKPTNNLNSTVFAVAKPNVNSDWRTMFRSPDFPMIIENGGNRLGYYDIDDVGFKPSGHTWVQNEVALASVEMRNGDVNFRKNGTQGSSITTINLASQSMNYFGNNQLGSQPFGKISEVITFNTGSTLSATDKNKIESYLAVKYGITLSHDYLATDGTVTWSVTSNAGYNNNIAGIGRDDATGLNQKKSSSTTGSGGVTIDNGVAFSADKTFIVWGDDAGSGSSPNIPSSYSLRSRRIWKVAVTGTTGAVSISIDLSTIGMPNSGVASNFTLLKDTDTDFSTGATPHTAGVSLSGNVLTFTGVTFVNGNYFTIAESNMILPGGVVGATFWVKANAGVTGTTGVNPWADQSGNANDLTQSTVANQPSLVNADINFNPDVNFSGANTIMAPTKPTANLNSTVFAVARPNAKTTWRTILRGTGTAHHPMIVESGSDRLGYYDNSGFQNGGFTWAQNEIAVMTMEMRTGDVNFRKNGTQGASITTINLSGQTMASFGNTQNTGQPFGKIAEVITYNTTSALTALEKSKIESYLAIKYGVTLTHDYIATDGTINWSITANNGYNNNITGIGRDDATALDQRKSIGINPSNIVTINKGSSFATDKSFLMWGDDNTSLSSWTTTEVPTDLNISNIQRVAREWKVAAINSPGAATVSINVSGLPALTGSFHTYALLVDADGNFGAGSTLYPLVLNSGSQYDAANISFGNTSYFTIAIVNNMSLTTGAWSDASTWAAGVVPAGKEESIILNGHTVTLTANQTVGSVAIQPGGTLNLSSFKLSVDQGTIVNSGTFTPSAGTVEYSGLVNQTIGDIPYFSLATSGSGTKTLAANTTINGDLTMGSGTTFSSGANNYNTNIGGNFINNGGTFVPGTNTVTFIGNSASIQGSVATQQFNNIVVNKSAGQTLSTGGSVTTIACNNYTQTSGSFNASGLSALNVNTTPGSSNIVLSAGTFTAPTTIKLTGNWINNGATFTTNSGTVNFVGNAGQTIGGSNITSFNNLTINTGLPTNLVRLNGIGTAVTNVLALTQGGVDLNSQTLSITNTATSAITRTSGYIKSETPTADNPSRVKWAISKNTAASYVFPFGVSSAVADYIPVTFVNQQTATAYTLTVSTRATGSDNLPLSTGANLETVFGKSANTVIDRWWDFSTTTNPLAAPGADITFSYRGAENTLTPSFLQTGSLLIQHWDAANSRWEDPLAGNATGVTGASVGTITITGATKFSSFVAVADLATEVNSSYEPKEDVVFYPNPLMSLNELKMSVKGSKDEKAQVTIYGIDGRIYLTKGFYLTDNNAVLSFDAATAIPAGSYIVFVTVGNNAYREKILITGK